MSFNWCEAKDAALRAVGRTPDDWKGEQAFSNWAVQGWLWLLFEYALPGFIRKYIQKLFERRCDENMQLMRGWAGRAVMKQLSMKALRLTIISGHDAPHSRKEIRCLSILSFGCGPGTAAVALLKFLRQQLPKLFPGVDIRFKVTLVDAVIASHAVGGMEPVMACLPSFLNLCRHQRLCTQRCTGSGDAAALRRHSLTHSHVLLCMHSLQIHKYDIHTAEQRLPWL
jgi:hypothetical protein